MIQGKAVEPRPDERLALADLLLPIARSGKVTDETRTRLQSDLAARGFTSIRAYPGIAEEEPYGCRMLLPRG